MNVAFIAMTLWVLNIAHSATCHVCLVIGCLVIAAAHSKVFRRHPTSLKLLAPAVFLSLSDSGIWFRNERGPCRGRGQRPNAHRQNYDMEIRCQHGHLIRSLAPATKASGWVLGSNCFRRNPVSAE